MACCNLFLSTAVWAIVASNEFKSVKPLCVPTRLDVYLQKIFYREKKNKSQMSLKENSSPRVIIFIIRCSPWIIKFGLTSYCFIFPIPLIFPINATVLPTLAFDNETKFSLLPLVEYGRTQDGKPGIGQLVSPNFIIQGEHRIINKSRKLYC